MSWATLISPLFIFSCIIYKEPCFFLQATIMFDLLNFHLPHPNWFTMPTPSNFHAEIMFRSLSGTYLTSFNTSLFSLSAMRITLLVSIILLVTWLPIFTVPKFLFLVWWEKSFMGCTMEKWFWVIYPNAFIRCNI